MFFGLSLRQLVFSVLACIVAVALYFLLRSRLPLETLSWLCILGAAPFGMVGFLKYHGMTAERFIWAWIKSEILIPKRLCFRAVNIYEEMMSPKYKSKKERKRVHDKDAQEHIQTR
jgi:hypothetical protein